MPVVLDPVFDAQPCPFELLANRAAHDPWCTTPVRKPIQLESEEGDPPPDARMEAAETQDLRLLRRVL